jgi:hypothetical protein
MNKFNAIIAAILISLLNCDNLNDNNQICIIDGLWIRETDTLSISNKTIYSSEKKLKNGFNLLNDCYLRQYLNDGTSKLCVYEFRNDSLRIKICPTDSKPYYSINHDELIGIWQNSDSMSIEFKLNNTLIMKDGSMIVNGSYKQDNCKLIMHGSDSISIDPETSYVLIENDSLYLNTIDTNFMWYMKN